MFVFNELVILGSCPGVSPIPLGDVAGWPREEDAVDDVPLILAFDTGMQSAAVPPNSCPSSPRVQPLGVVKLGGGVPAPATVLK